MSRSAGGPDWRSIAASLGLVTRTVRNVPALLQAAHELTVRGEPRAAVEAYREALQLEPGHRGALLGLLTLLQAQGRQAEAAWCRRRLIELDVDRLGLGPAERAATLAFRLAAAGLGPRPERAPASYIAEGFDRYAHHYDAHVRSALQYQGPELAYQAIARLIDPATLPLDILDLGCGTGLAAPVFRPLARRLDGIDLSPGMLVKARALQLYDDLALGDVAEIRQLTQETYDLLLALDVLNYLGDLAPVLAAAAGALRARGLLLLTIESGTGDRYTLCSTGRYTHDLPYVRDEASAVGLEETSAEPVVFRHEQGRPVAAHLIVLRKTGRAAGAAAPQ